MTDPTIFLVAFVLMFCITLFASYWYGRTASRAKGRLESIQNVRDYLDHEIPNEWTAYKKGVGDGYEQGLRDSVEDSEGDNVK